MGWRCDPARRYQEGTWKKIMFYNFTYVRWYMKCFIYWTARLKSSELWSSQLWTQFKQFRIEAWKSQDFNGVWTRDLTIPVRRSNQLSYEATDVESWSFVSSNEPVKNRCEVIYEMFYILNCGFEIKWAMIIAVIVVYNCDDHSSLDFKSAVQYKKYFIYHFTRYVKLPLNRTPIILSKFREVA